MREFSETVDQYIKEAFKPFNEALEKRISYFNESWNGIFNNIQKDFLVSMGSAKYVNTEEPETRLPVRPLLKVHSVQTDRGISQGNHACVKIPGKVESLAESKNEFANKNAKQSSQIYVPTRKDDLRKWKATWNRIKNQVEDGKSITDISKWVNKMFDHLPSSPDTIRKIINAGEAGMLD